MSSVAILLSEAELEALIDKRIEEKLRACGGAGSVAVPCPPRDLLRGYVRKRDLTGDELESDETWQRREDLLARQLLQVKSVIGEWLRHNPHSRGESVLARLVDLTFHGVGDFYFFKPTPGDLIKIGSSTNIPERLQTIRTHAGVSRIDCVAFGPGGGRVERFLHYVFRETREDGEWFRPTLSMLDLIERFAATEWVWS